MATEKDAAKPKLATSVNASGGPTTQAREMAARTFELNAAKSMSWFFAHNPETVNI